MQGVSERRRRSTEASRLWSTKDTEALTYRGSEAPKHRGYQCRECLSNKGTEALKLWSTKGVKAPMHLCTRTLMQGVSKHRGVDALSSKNQRKNHRQQML
ncbi:UNVERIFIED_CONTAM: hypothetical protein FKN15_063129 [Acipenser sinensis]